MAGFITIGAAYEASSLRGAKRRSNPGRLAVESGLLRFARNDEHHRSRAALFFAPRVLLTTPFQKVAATRSSSDEIRQWMAEFITIGAAYEASSLRGAK